MVYERRQPDKTALARVVRENLKTLYAAVEDGFAQAPLPPFVRKELQGFLECGRRFDARVVETTTGKELIRVTHEGDVDALAFSPDGRVLYTGTVNEKVATLLRHLLRAEDLIAAICARLTRNLTAEEWKQYLGDSPYRMTCNPPGFMQKGR